MRLYKHYDGLLRSHRGGAIAIGNFDGVHLGHQEVIRTAGRIAKETGVPWGVLTFEPHPRTFFDPKGAPFRISPFHVKGRYIEDLGVDFLVVLHFDKELASMSSGAFVDDVLVRGFGASHIVSGGDFTFGHKRQGNTTYLKDQGREKGFETTSVKQVLDDTGEVISSTRVRQALMDAKPADAAQLLGRTYEIGSRVIKGDQRGRTIGFPTANILCEDNLGTALGGYAIRAGLDDGPNTVWHDGIANLGYRPTFDGTSCLLETHIFDFNQDIYGKHLRVGLVEFIRPEKKFDGIDALKAQIDADCGLAREMLAADAAKNG